MSKHDQYQILDHIFDPVVIIEPDYTIAFANTNLVERLNMKRSEIVGKKCYELFQHSPAPCLEPCGPQVECGHKEVFRTGLPVIVHHVHYQPDGSMKYFENSCSPIVDDKGVVVSVLQVMRDQAEVKELRGEIEAIQSEYDSLCTSIPFAVSYLDRDMRIVFLNAGMEQLIGRKSDEVKGLFCYDVCGQYANDSSKRGRERICDTCRIDKVLIGGRIQTHERTIGGRIIEVTTSPVRDSHGDIIGALEVGQDITARSEAEAEMARSKEEWERTFNAFSDTVTLHWPDFEIIKINRAGCETLELSGGEIIGRHCYELFDGIDEPCPDCPLVETLKDFQPHSNEIRHEKLGKTFLVSAAPVLDAQGNLEYIANVAQDITKRKKMEEQLFLSEKLATIAGLAAGVAHEINTPLSAILQSAQIIEQGLAADRPANHDLAAECDVDLDKVYHYLEKKELNYFLTGIRESAVKASGIINSLLDFSRPHKGELRRVNLTKLLNNALELARADYNLKKKYDILNVEINREYDLELPAVSCIPMEIEQVVLNLVKNAVQAMADADVKNPRITIRTKLLGNKARVEVEDNGPGMNADIKKHVFDPFFTTKEVGSGTGLGLSVSYAIIHDKHGGDIRVESEPGRGATFVVDLPL